jgi:hypothetical protein
MKLQISGKTLALIVLTVFVFYNAYVKILYAVNTPNTITSSIQVLNKLGTAAMPENMNAYPYYEKAIALSERLPEELNSDEIAFSWPKDLPEKKLILSKQWIAANSKALIQLESAAKMSYSWKKRSSRHNTVYGMCLLDLKKLEHLGLILNWRAKLAAIDSDFESSVKYILIAYQLGLHMLGPTFVPEQATGLDIVANTICSASLILERTEINPAMMGMLQSQIEQLIDRRTCALDLRAEKILVLDIIQKIVTDNGQINMKSATLVLNSLGIELTDEEKQAIKKLNGLQTVKSVKKTFSQLENRLSKEYWQQKREKCSIKKYIKNITNENVLIQLLLNNAIYEYEIRTVAMCKTLTNSLITSLAILRYRSERGCYPNKLDELVKNGYLSELLLDTFSGKPFVYRQANDDFKLYSYSFDCDDDGGKEIEESENENGDIIIWDFGKPIQKTP